MSLRKDLFKARRVLGGRVVKDNDSSLHKAASAQDHVEVLEDMEDDEGENSFENSPTTYVS